MGTKTPPVNARIETVGLLFECVHSEVQVENIRIKEVLSDVTGIEDEEEKREFCSLNERE